MGGCQNYGLFLGTLNIRCRTILGIQKGIIILTTTHMAPNSRYLGPNRGQEEGLGRDATLQIIPYFGCKSHLHRAFFYL